MFGAIDLPNSEFKKTNKREDTSSHHYSAVFDLVKTHLIIYCSTIGIFIEIFSETCYTRKIKRTSTETPVGTMFIPPKRWNHWELLGNRYNICSVLCIHFKTSASAENVILGKIRLILFLREELEKCCQLGYTYFIVAIYLFILKHYRCLCYCKMVFIFVITEKYKSLQSTICLDCIFAVKNLYRKQNSKIAVIVIELLYYYMLFSNE